LKAIKVVVGTLLIASIGFAQEQNTTFVLRLPRGVKPETAAIHYSVSSVRGGLITSARVQKDKFDYPLLPADRPFDVGPFRALKILLYVPGYRMVTANFGAEELARARIFEPTLEALPTTQFHGQLLDSKNEPRPSQSLSLDYNLLEAMPFFGYLDGSVPTIPIATFQTDKSGAFSVDIPALTEDPFFKEGSFVLISRLPGSSPLSPNRFTPQQASQRHVITQTMAGTFSGRLGKDFFALKGLASDVKLLPPPAYIDRLNVELMVQDTSGGWTRFDLLKGDGTFELQLPPGKYDVSVNIEVGKEKRKTVSVLQGLIIREGEREVLELP